MLHIGRCVSYVGAFPRLRLLPADYYDSTVGLSTVTTTKLQAPSRRREASRRAINVHARATPGEARHENRSSTAFGRHVNSCLPPGTPDTCGTGRESCAQLLYPMPCHAGPQTCSAGELSGTTRDTATYGRHVVTLHTQARSLENIDSVRTC